MAHAHHCSVTEQLMAQKTVCAAPVGPSLSLATSEPCTVAIVECQVVGCMPFKDFFLFT